MRNAAALRWPTAFQAARRRAALCKIMAALRQRWRNLTAVMRRKCAWMRSALCCLRRHRVRWGCTSSHSAAAASSSSSSMSVSFRSSWASTASCTRSPSPLAGSFCSFPPSASSPPTTSVGPVDWVSATLIAITCRGASTSWRESIDLESSSMPGPTEDEQQSITKSISRASHGMPELASRIKAGRSRRAMRPPSARRSKATEAKRYME
mmetsp:Transcript_37641/g.75317  ORF Transcript_37641/g.75317 Transcript_37641/m.75317 type:complete len:209 (-) Transcript_37641:362-988(-)